MKRFNPVRPAVHAVDRSKDDKSGKEVSDSFGVKDPHEEPIDNKDEDEG